MKLPLSLALVMLAVSAASASTQGCSSTNVTIIQGDGGADGSGGIVFPSEDAGPSDAASSDAPATDGTTTGGAKNPYGASYPTAHIGSHVRSGSTPGDVLADLTLTGYAAGASTVTTGSLADLFDPEGRTHDMVAAILVSRWDAYSNMMAMTLASGLPARVALFVVVGEGSTAGTAATSADLTAWHTKYPSIASYLDPSWGQWKPLITVDAVPYVIELDARTMEIVSAEAGALPSPKSDLEAAASAIAARPASY